MRFLHHLRQNPQSVVAVDDVKFLVRLSRVLNCVSQPRLERWIDQFALVLLLFVRKLCNNKVCVVLVLTLIFKGNFRMNALC